MKLYLYTYNYDIIQKEGYKSLALLDKTDVFLPRLHVYDKMAGSDKTEDILAYLEKTFPGRLRSVCVLVHPAPVKEYRHRYLNMLVHCADLLSFDLDRLLRDDIVEAIYCKDCLATIIDRPCFENIYSVTPNQIDARPYDWDLCCTEKYIQYSPWATIKHYFLVLKHGLIPPVYITQEVDHSQQRANLFNPMK